MLTLRDLQLNFYALELFSKYQVLFFSFDKRTRRLEATSDKKRILVLGLRNLITFLAIFFKGVRLVQSLYDDSLFNLTSLCCNIIFVLLAGYVFILNVNLYVHDWKTAIAQINQVHQDKPSGNSWNTFGGQLRQNWRGYAPTELIIIFLPLYLFYIIPGCLIIYSIDVEAAHLFYSVVPRELKGGLMLGLCLALDMWIVVETVVSFYFAAYFAMSFMIPHLCEDVLSRLALKISSSSKGSDFTAMAQAIRKLVQTRVEILLFNEICATVIYIAKVMALSISVALFFAGIKLLGDEPIIAAVLFASAWYATFFYIALYGRCWEIPEKIEEVKGIIQQCSWKNPALIVRKYIERKLRAIPPSGIKAGSFYVIDRMTAPEFVDFVFSQVVDLLVGF